MASNSDGSEGVSLFQLRNSSTANCWTVVKSCVVNRKCGLMCPVAKVEIFEN